MNGRGDILFAETTWPEDIVVILSGASCLKEFLCLNSGLRFLVYIFGERFLGQGKLGRMSRSELRDPLGIKLSFEHTFSLETIIAAKVKLMRLVVLNNLYCTLLNPKFQIGMLGLNFSGSIHMKK